MRLKDFNIGDYVNIFWNGSGRWDNRRAKIIEKEGILITVQYDSGWKAGIIRDIECRKFGG